MRLLPVPIIPDTIPLTVACDFAVSATGAGQFADCPSAQPPEETLCYAQPVHDVGQMKILRLDWSPFFNTPGRPCISTAKRVPGGKKMGHANFLADDLETVLAQVAACREAWDARVLRRLSFLMKARGSVFRRT